MECPHCGSEDVAASAGGEVPDGVRVGCRGCGKAFNVQFRCAACRNGHLQRWGRFNDGSQRWRCGQCLTTVAVDHGRQVKKRDGSVTKAGSSPIACAHCRQGNLVKWGFFKDKVQRFRCNSCFVFTSFDDQGRQVPPRGKAKTRPGQQRQRGRGSGAEPGSAAATAATAATAPAAGRAQPSSSKPKPAEDPDWSPTPAKPRTRAAAAKAGPAEPEPETAPCQACPSGTLTAMSVGGSPGRSVRKAARRWECDSCRGSFALVGGRFVPKTAAAGLPPPPEAAAAEKKRPLKAAIVATGGPAPNGAAAAAAEPLVVVTVEGDQPKKRLKVRRYVGADAFAPGGSAAVHAWQRLRPRPAQNLGLRVAAARRSRSEVRLEDVMMEHDSTLHPAIAEVLPVGPGLLAGAARRLARLPRVAVCKGPGHFLDVGVLRALDADGAARVQFNRGPELAFAVREVVALHRVAGAGFDPSTVAYGYPRTLVGTRVAVAPALDTAHHLRLGTVAAGPEAGGGALRVVFDDGEARDVQFAEGAVFWLGPPTLPVFGPGMNGVRFDEAAGQFQAEWGGRDLGARHSADAAALAYDAEVLHQARALPVREPLNSALAREPHTAVFGSQTGVRLLWLEACEPVDFSVQPELDAELPGGTPGPTGAAAATSPPAAPPAGAEAEAGDGGGGARGPTPGNAPGGLPSTKGTEAPAEPNGASGPMEIEVPAEEKAAAPAGVGAPPSSALASAFPTRQGPDWSPEAAEIRQQAWALHQKLESAKLKCARHFEALRAKLVEQAAQKAKIIECGQRQGVRAAEIKELRWQVREREAKLEHITCEGLLYLKNGLLALEG